MRFAFSEEQVLLRQAAETFLARELPIERVRAADAEGAALHAAMLPRLAAAGFTGVLAPADAGGADAGATAAAVLLETIGGASLSLASVLLAAIGFGPEVVARTAPAALRRDLLSRVAQGDAVFAALIGHPDVPLAEGSLPVAARPVAGGFELNGPPVLVPGAAQASHLLIAARLPDGDSALFLVAPSGAGPSLRPVEAIGLRSAGGVSEVAIERLRVPGSALLAAGAAVRAAVESGWRLEHMLQAAACVGCAARVIGDAVRHAGERRQFDQPIGKFQAIAHLLADLQVKLDGARWLVYAAARTLDDGRDAAAAVAMAKLAASEAVLDTTSQAMRVFGGYGLTMEFDVQRPFRDARHFLVGPGASRHMRDVVARALGLSA